MAKVPALGTPLHMEVIENKSYFDTLNDEVGRLIAEINPSDNQSDYRKSKKRLEAYVLRHRGQMFRFRKERMALVGSNDSVLIKVGPAKRGHLAAYRGHWIRVIWYGTYGFSMDCLVHKVKMPNDLEDKLIPRGPYTKEEFTEEMAKNYPFRSVVVEGETLLRAQSGRWVSPIPTEKALDNLEKDEIPDGNYHYRKVLRTSGSGYDMVGYHKYAGLWIKTIVTREELNSGKLDWLPVGVRVSVERAGDLPRGSLIRTQDGWKFEANI